MYKDFHYIQIIIKQKLGNEIIAKFELIFLFVKESKRQFNNSRGLIKL